MSLKDEGISPYWCIHHGITVSMYYGDPDGNQMEFQVDCFAENDEANAFMYRSFSSGRASPRPGGESDRLSPALIDITSTPVVEELPYTSVSRAEQPARG